MVVNNPSSTLYLNNLNDKVNKEELRTQLYSLFTTHGKIIDIVASKTQRMRGQAFLVFTDLAAATAALRACNGLVFYDKPLRIDYAKAKSYATLRREDPTFVPPSAPNASAVLAQNANAKRSRDGDTDGQPSAKRDKPDEDCDEMEIDDDDSDDDVSAKTKTEKSVDPSTIPAQVQDPTARLLCTNLPQEVTDDVLSVLFQQYPGFQSTRVTWSPTPNPGGVRVKMAQVVYDTPELSTTARDALDGFTLKKDWKMSVVYI